LLQNALEHGGEAVRIELSQRNGEVVLAIADDAAASTAKRQGRGCRSCALSCATSCRAGSTSRAKTVRERKSSFRPSGRRTRARAGRSSRRDT
jgi:hypothetical protein